MALLQLGMSACGPTGRSPEAVAKAEAVARIRDDLPGYRHTLVAEDSAAVAQDSNAAAPWHQYRIESERTTLEAVRRLAAPLGDTAAVERTFRIPAPAVITKTVGAARRAGLIRDSASEEAIFADAIRKAPLAALTDTIWAVQTRQGWKVWTGAHVRRQLDSLQARIDAVDGPIVSLTARRAAADTLERLLRLPVAITWADSARHKQLADAVENLAWTKRLSDSLRLTATIRGGPWGVAEVTATGLPRERFFSVQFRIRDANGALSKQRYEDFFGQDHRTVNLGSASRIGQAQDQDWVSGPGSVELITIRELDVVRMRRSLGLQ